MDNPLVAVVFGLAIVVFAAAWMYSHVVAWRREQQDGRLDDNERQFFYRRYRRRMQTSGMILAIGVVIPVGDQLLTIAPSALWFTLYCLLLLLLTAWAFLLALGDMAATNVHRRASLARNRRKQRELMEEIGRIQAPDRNGGHRNNGHDR